MSNGGRQSSVGCDSAVYCTCRGPDDGSVMIQCEGCEEWFHIRCLGLSPLQVKRSNKEQFVCSKCQKVCLNDGLIAEVKKPSLDEIESTDKSVLSKNSKHASMNVFSDDCTFLPSNPVLEKDSSCAESNERRRRTTGFVADQPFEMEHSNDDHNSISSNFEKCSNAFNSNSQSNIENSIKSNFVNNSVIEKGFMETFTNPTSNGELELKQNHGQEPLIIDSNTNSDSHWKGRLSSLSDAAGNEKNVMSESLLVGKQRNSRKAHLGEENSSKRNEVKALIIGGFKKVFATFSSADKNLSQTDLQCNNDKECTDLKDSSNGSWILEDQLSASIEDALFSWSQREKGNHSLAYRQRYRQILSSLKDPLNGELRLALRLGTLSPNQLLLMDVISLANAQVADEMRKVQKSSLIASIRSTSVSDPELLFKADQALDSVAPDRMNPSNTKAYLVNESPTHPAFPSSFNKKSDGDFTPLSKEQSSIASGELPAGHLKLDCKDNLLVERNLVAGPLSSLPPLGWEGSVLAPDLERWRFGRGRLVRHCLGEGRVVCDSASAFSTTLLLPVNIHISGRINSESAMQYLSQIISGSTSRTVIVLAFRDLGPYWSSAEDKMSVSDDGSHCVKNNGSINIESDGKSSLHARSSGKSDLNSTKDADEDSTFRGDSVGTKVIMMKNSSLFTSLLFPNTNQRWAVVSHDPFNGIKDFYLAPMSSAAHILFPDLFPSESIEKLEPGLLMAVIVLSKELNEGALNK